MWLVNIVGGAREEAVFHLKVIRHGYKLWEFQLKQAVDQHMAERIRGI
ncbi:hypothetical protein [Paenibacillus polysaccharolyticus]|nr:hypothetical protein [Paenibacillus polysaccharolyticus]